MFTKEMLKSQLCDMGIQHNDTVLIHTSMKAVGDVLNGADGVIDAFCEYLSDGLFLVPTHTWGVVNQNHPFFDVRTTIPNIGALPRVAAFREDGIRSLHCTHSIWAHGKEAAHFVQGEEMAQTPCPIGSAWSRLASAQAKILLLGVGHDRNTFIHAIDELADIPNRIDPRSYEVSITDQAGSIIRHPMHPHFCTLTDAVSDYFINFDQPLIRMGAQHFGIFGNAKVRIVDAKMCQEIILRIYQRTNNYDRLLITPTISERLYLP